MAEPLAVASHRKPKNPTRCLAEVLHWSVWERINIGVLLLWVVVLALPSYAPTWNDPEMASVDTRLNEGVWIV